jgi:polynucleotide 5'-hydroxyl-kinase GRC3/NOL9
MMTEAGWERARDRATRSRLTVLVGGVDTGKTSLATFLANGLLARGFQVGVVDADLGQSEIGPPTTIGLGRVTRTLDRLGDADMAGFSFVGSTSPQGHVRSTLAATRYMVDRAFAEGLDRVVVDTCGLIDGPLGRIYTQGQIDRLDPDLVVAVQRREECEPIVRTYDDRERPEIVRVPAGEHVRRRTAVERRRHRAAALDRYFQDAGPQRLALPRLRLRIMTDQSCPVPLETRDDLESRLVGLDDAEGATLGLGAIRGIDVIDRVVLVNTPVADQRVAGLRVGRDALRSLEPVR